jgi:hypothetical protein
VELLGSEFKFISPTPTTHTPSFIGWLQALAPGHQTEKLIAHKTPRHVSVSDQIFEGFGKRQHEKISLQSSKPVMHTCHPSYVGG